MIPFHSLPFGKFMLEDSLPWKYIVFRICQMSISCFLRDMNFISKLFSILFNQPSSVFDPHLHKKILWQFGTHNFKQTKMHGTLDIHFFDFFKFCESHIYKDNMFQDVLYFLYFLKYLCDNWEAHGSRFGPNFRSFPNHQKSIAICPGP